MATDAMTILYGADGTGGVAGHIREETIKTIHNYLGELSTDEVVDMLSEISEADEFCLLYTSPSPRDATLSRMPSSA